MLAAPVAARAHHILGLPHYKYGDDYPQIPLVEVKAQVAQYDLFFTYFPGTPRPGEQVRFKLYIVDRDTGEPYRKPLTYDLWRERTVRDDVRLQAPTPIEVGVGPEANDYKFFYTFDDADRFALRVRFEYEGGVEVIRFPVQIGETDTRPVFFGAIGILGLSVVAVAFIKRRRGKPGADKGRKRAARRKAGATA